MPGRVRTEKNHGIETWDLKTLKQRSHWMVQESWKHPSSRGVFSSDSRVFAYLHVDPSSFVVRFYDAEQGKELGSSKVPANKADVSELRSIPPDGAYWSCVYHEKEQTSLIMLEAASGRILWRKPYYGDFIRAANDTVCWSDPDDDASILQFLKPSSGMCYARSGLRSAMVRKVTPDGKHLVTLSLNSLIRELYSWEEWLQERWPQIFQNRSESVQVWETGTTREVFCVGGMLDLGDKESISLSDDGSTLVTVDWTDQDGSTICIKAWDIHPTRAWFWSFTAAALTGFALLALRWLWRKLRTSKQPPASAPVGLPSQ